MTVAIQWIRIGHWSVGAGVSIAGEVKAGDDFRGGESAGLNDVSVVGVISRDRAWSTEVRVRVVDARIDDRDLHSLTRVAARRCPCAGGFNKGHAGRVVDGVEGKTVHGFDVGVAFEFGHETGVDFRSDTVVSRLHSVKRSGLATGRAELRQHTLLRAPDSCHL